MKKQGAYFGHARATRRESDTGAWKTLQKLQAKDTREDVCVSNRTIRIPSRTWEAHRGENKTVERNGRAQQSTQQKLVTNLGDQFLIFVEEANEVVSIFPEFLISI